MMSPRRWLLLLLACLLMFTISPTAVSALAGTSTSQPDEANYQSVQTVIGLLLLDEDEEAGMTYKVYIPWLATRD